MSTVSKPLAMRVFQHLPDALQTRIRNRYDTTLRTEFIAALFESASQYECYCQEFRDKDLHAHRDTQLSEWYPNATITGGLGETAAMRLYALLRAQHPQIVVETGVHHGMSTLTILAALDENDQGELHSIDLPYRTDRSREDLRTQTAFDGPPPLPPGNDPGWIVPKQLHSRWEIRLGRVQRELPLLLADLETVDLYLRDSEHTLPCMLFEFEAAWEWLSPGGILISDDIARNDAFAVFARERGGDPGNLAPLVGYLQKPEGATR